MITVTRSLFCTLAMLAGLSGVALGQVALSKAEKRVIADFESRVAYYGEMRDKLQKRMPAPSKDATPKEIEAHKAALQKSVEFARRNARQGNLFTPAAAPLFRKIIRGEFVGWERNELRKTVLEETRGIKLAVNKVYPESKELIEMSPDLLLTLPQLPKSLRYRFVGHSFAILDRDTQLIIDYFGDALP